MDQYRQGSGRQAAWMNYLLIAVNVLVFAVGTAGTGRIWDAGFFYRAGALYAPLLLKGQGFYRLVTSIFLHADLTHLFNNMVVQFAGGEVVEKNLGHFRYGILYVLCGIGGNLVSAATDFCTGQYGYSVGASGAVFGVIGALLFMILRRAADMKKPRTGRGWSGGPGPAEEPFAADSPAASSNRAAQARMKSLLIRAGLMTVYLLYSGWSNPLVNQAAHVGGLIIGFVLTAVLLPRGESDLSDLM